MTGAERTAAWRVANPERVRAQKQRARDRRRGLGIPPAPRNRVRKRRTPPRAPSVCRACSKETGRATWARFCTPCLTRHNRLKERHGITIFEYLRMHTEQQGRCAICGGGQNGHGCLHVDHCHATGKIRGLLCWICNVGLGRFRDSPDNLRRAADYLTRAAESP